MADHSMNHIENQRMDEYETRSETVSPLAVVCCFLFLILILLGIALVAAGGVVYQQNDNYMEVRTKALSKAITMWETECQGKMESLGDVVFQVEQSNHKEIISGQSGTAAHVITELDNSPSVQVTFKHANAKPKKDSISVSAYMKSDKDRSIATVKDIPLRRTIDVPAVCECKSVGHSTPCYCKGKQICGKDVTFVGDEQNCTNGKVCGRCQGEGHLKQICLISKICDGSLVQSEFSGCAAPFSGDALSQVYGVESRDVTVFLYDENTPSIAKFRVSGGVGMNGPSKEKEQSRLKGTILFGVGIPVVVLAFISLIIICACQKWWCFGTSQSKNALEFNDIDIPMHGLNTMPSQNELHSTNYVNINERCTY